MQIRALIGSVLRARQHVLSKSRGEGIGSKLIDYAISEAKKEGCKRITLLTDIENTKAQSFYQKKGFMKSKMTPYRIYEV
ncbi:N-acetyltransferase [Polynucleobacter sp. IMCC 29146]|uniref:GNAT family N-acetyltransferase n=1 Tax=Polynucleobacter sp. IMCC 29146 TaxID=2780953 RepID=UPI001F36219A|nr:GNAT family N-acetyltransferase [Polynucleobacter sp. IMCC 29146]MCE7530549.1 GNAT family N-acetyltransferase [Polynucleobacter sp. IMCC 29146]